MVVSTQIPYRQYIEWAVVNPLEDMAGVSLLFADGQFLLSLSGAGEFLARLVVSPTGLNWGEARYDFTAPATAYGNGKFVLKHVNSATVLTAPELPPPYDAVDWTSNNSGDADRWNGMAFGDGIFVAVKGVGENRIITSPDGETWTPRVAPDEEADWQAITYGDGLFVAVAREGQYRIMTSPDGINWTPRVPSSIRPLHGVTYGDGLFVAVGSGGVMTSPDGVTWTDYPFDGLFVDVTYGDGWYVAVGTATFNNILTSRDGVNWTASSAPEASEWRVIAYGNGVFVSVGRQGENRVMIGTPRAGIGDEPVFLPLSPNWAQPLRESYEFKTDIITSWDGKEQRRAIRFNPRIEIDFLAHLHGWTKSQLDQFMAARQPRETWLPRFVQFATSTISMPPEATVLAVSGDTSWLAPGMTVALYDGKGRLESRVVASVGTGTLTFTDESMTEFPIGSRISPVYRGRIQVTPKVERLTNDIATMRVQFSVDPGSFTYAPAPGDSFVDFREAFMRGPNWGGGVTLDHVWPRETVDYEFGRVEHFVPYEFPSRITRMNFVGRDKDDVKSAIDFFWRHRGRWKEFVMPTWENDVPYAFIAAGSRSILVDGTDFGAAYADSTVYRRIVLRMADGTFHHRAVDFVDVLQDTDTSVLWTTEDLPALSLTPSTMFGISWGLVSRLSSDRLDIDWLTDSVAQFSLTFQSLENFDIQ